MITVYYAVCSEQGGKPVVRAAFESQTKAEAALEVIRSSDGRGAEDSYWVAEIGKESESWLRFLPDNETEPVD